MVKIKELMGHASIVTTMRYIHATDQIVLDIGSSLLIQGNSTQQRLPDITTAGLRE